VGKNGAADGPFISGIFFFSSRRRHTRSKRDWSSDVCSSDLVGKRSAGLLVREPQTDVERLRRRRAGVARGPPGDRRGGATDAERSEERRVGKECKTRGAPAHSTK